MAAATERTPEDACRSSRWWGSYPTHGTIEAPPSSSSAPPAPIGAAWSRPRRSRRPAGHCGRANPRRLERLRREHARGRLRRCVAEHAFATTPTAPALADECVRRPVRSVASSSRCQRAISGGPPPRSPDRRAARPARRRRCCHTSRIARHLMPLLAEARPQRQLRDDRRPGSDAPWAGYGHRSVAMAALRMLARVLHDEAQLARRARAPAVDRFARCAARQPAAHECPEWPSRSRRRPARRCS